MRPVQARRVPVVVEAYFLTEESYPSILNWSNGKVHTTGGDDTPEIVVETLEGRYFVDHDTHWIIKGIRGEFYPVEKSIFESIYQADFEAGYVVHSNDRIKFGER